MASKLDAKHHQETVVKRGGGKHHEEEHGGAWKVAFADFCLALLCLFLVLWLMAARQTESLQEIVRSSSMLAEGQGQVSDTLGGPRGSLIDRHPLPSSLDGKKPSREGSGAHALDESGQGARLSKSRLESRADLQELARILESMGEKAGLSGHVQTVVTPYGLRVMLHDTERQGMFQLGSSNPSESFRLLLRKMGPLFAQIENQMLIVGHTDSRQYAGGELAGFSNWTLSTNRAMAARAQLMEGGMGTRSVLQVVGMADRALLYANDSTAASNRRIELLILTPGQSQAVAAMFGAPENLQPLVPGVGIGLAERGELGALRQRLQFSDGGVARAN